MSKISYRIYQYSTFRETVLRADSITGGIRSDINFNYYEYDDDGDHDDDTDTVQMVLDIMKFSTLLFFLCFMGVNVLPSSGQ